MPSKEKNLIWEQLIVDHSMENNASSDVECTAVPFLECTAVPIYKSRAAFRNM